MEIVLWRKRPWKFVCPKVTDRIDDDSNDSQKRQDPALANILMSINSSCKASLMTGQDPEKVWIILKTDFQALFEAAVDAKLTQLQQMSIRGTEPGLKYASRNQVR